MSRNVLPRLLELRRLNEKKALEELIRRQADLQRAEEAVEEASASLARHTAAARDREFQLLQAAGGHVLSLFDVVDLQAQIEIMGLDTERLRAAENAALSRRYFCLQALTQARAVYRQRQQATMKIELLIQQEKAKGSRSFAALVEDEPAVSG